MGIFSYDSPLMRGLSRVADVMILNILFIICCIPIFTIGASLTAMSYVLLRLHNGEEGYIARGFFKSFRENFRQATVIWLLFLLLGALSVVSLYFLGSMSGTFYIAVSVLLIIVMLLLAFALLYVFAVLARFENTILNTIKNAFLMSLLDFPKTVVMLLIVVASVVVSLINETTLYWALLIWIVGGFGLIGYCNSWFLNGILKKYMPKDEEETEEEVLDAIDNQSDQTME